MQPGIGYVADSQVSLLRKLVWNTYVIAGGTGGGVPPVWVAVPATSTSAGTAGQMAYDGSYLYVCVQNSLWRRTPIDDWA